MGVDLITFHHKYNLMTTSREGLALFDFNQNEFLRSLKAVDELLIRNNTMETKQQSKQCISWGKSAPK